MTHAYFPCKKANRCRGKVRHRSCAETYHMDCEQPEGFIQSMSSALASQLTYPSDPTDPNVATPLRQTPVLYGISQSSLLAQRQPVSACVSRVICADVRRKRSLRRISGQAAWKRVRSSAEAASMQLMLALTLRAAGLAFETSLKPLSNVIPYFGQDNTCMLLLLQMTSYDMLDSSNIHLLHIELICDL